MSVQNYIRSLSPGKKFIAILLSFIIIFTLIFTIWFAIEQNETDGKTTASASFHRSHNDDTKEYFSDPFTDAFYFTTTSFGTFGYGDIYPQSTLAKFTIAFMHLVVITLTMNLYSHYTSKNQEIEVQHTSEQLKKLKNVVELMQIAPSQKQKASQLLGQSANSLNQVNINNSPFVGPSSKKSLWGRVQDKVLPSDSFNSINT